MKDCWSSLDLGYGHQLGCKLLREDIVANYFESGNAISIIPDDINVVVPAEGIFLAMTTLLEPSSHCVVTTPSYQSLHQLAESRGCDVSRWSPTISEDGSSYNFDVDELISMINPSTRMVVLNFPHNPTGGTITPSELNSIVDACRLNDSYIFMDEMYKYLEVRSEEERSDSKIPPTTITNNLLLVASLIAAPGNGDTPLRCDALRKGNNSRGGVKVGIACWDSYRVAGLEGRICHEGIREDEGLHDHILLPTFRSPRVHRTSQ